ncbi:hypothetical protein [Fodinicola feengrottensis]|nr:hypothetical protein [Fodinicola feengrottensis]
MTALLGQCHAMGWLALAVVFGLGLVAGPAAARWAQRTRIEKAAIS